MNERTFPTKREVVVERKRRNSLLRQVASSETQVLRKRGWIPSRLYASLVFKIRERKTPLEKIMMLGINELKGDWEEGIVLGSSRMELKQQFKQKIQIYNYVLL